MESTQIAILGIAYLFLVISYIVISLSRFKKRQLLQKTKNSYLSELNDVFKKINQNMRIYIDNNESSKLNNEVVELSKTLADFKNKFEQELIFTEKEKEEYRKLFLTVNNSVDTAVTSLSEDNSDIVAEKGRLEQEIAEFKSNSRQEIASHVNEVEELKVKLGTLLGLYKGVDLQSLKQGIETLQQANDDLMQKLSVQRKKYQPEILIQNEHLNEIRNRVELVATDRLQQINNLHDQNVSLQKELDEYKQSFISNAQFFAKTKQEMHDEIARLNDGIKNAELGNEEFIQLLGQNDTLKRELHEFTRKLASEKQQFEKEIELKNNDIREYESYARAKEEEIVNHCKSQEEILISRQKEIEQEIERIKSQLKKLDASTKDSQLQLRKELEVMRDLHQQKSKELAELKTNNDEVSASKNNEIKLQINSIKDKIKEETFNFHNIIKAKEEELYTLKVRLGARDDRLRSDIEKRRQAQENLLIELRQIADQLRNKMNEKTGDAKNRLQSISDKVNSLSENITSMQVYIENERKVAEMIENQRKQIESEVQMSKDKFLSVISDVNSILDLKKKELDIVSKELFEKEKLFKVESEGRQKIAEVDFNLKSIKREIEAHH